MGKSFRYPLEHGKRRRNDERSDLMNPNNDAYDGMLDIYSDPLDFNSEYYDCNEEDEDDI